MRGWASRHARQDQGASRGAEEHLLEALEREVERGVGRDAPRREAAGAVAFVSRDLKLADLADLHAEAALVPAGDHATHARVVREGLLPRVFCVPELLPLDLAAGVDRRILPR